MYGSKQIRRSGPPAAAERVARCAHVEKFLAELNALSSIVRVTGVARMRVSKLVKKAQQVDLP